MVLPKFDGAPPVDPGDAFFCSIERTLRKFVRNRVLRHRMPWSYVEDISQEILLQVAKHVDLLRGANDDHRDAWLQVVTRNVVSNAARRWRRSRDADARWPGAHRVRMSGEWTEGPKTPEERVISPDDGPEAKASIDEFRRAFVVAFERLPFRYRNVLSRWLIYGETCSEIARRDGRTRSVIARLLTSGLALLATYLPGFGDF